MKPAAAPCGDCMGQWKEPVRKKIKYFWLPLVIQAVQIVDVVPLAPKSNTILQSICTLFHILHSKKEIVHTLSASNIEAASPWQKTLAT